MRQVVLLEALRALVKRTEETDNPGDMGVGTDDDTMIAARAAIARAESDGSLESDLLDALKKIRDLPEGWSQTTGDVVDRDDMLAIANAAIAKAGEVTP